jgi:hypothetical protein
MSLMRCRSCSTRFAVGLLRCPQCQAFSELYAVQDHVAEAKERSMPKITVGGGASNAADEPDDAVADEASAVEETVETDAVADKQPAAVTDEPTAEETPTTETTEVQTDAVPDEKSKPATAKAAKKTAAAKP